MWDLPRPGLEPVSLALAGRFSTTAPPGKPPDMYFTNIFSLFVVCVFILSALPFTEQKFLILIKSYLIFSFMDYAFSGISKDSYCQTQGHISSFLNWNIFFTLVTIQEKFLTSISFLSFFLKKIN